MKALIIAQHDGKQLSPHTAKLVTALKAIASVDILIAGGTVSDIAQQAAQLADVDQVICAEDNALTHLLAETVTSLIIQHCTGYDYYVSAASTFGKNIMPRIAAKLNVAAITDVTTLCDANTFIRPIYAGNAIITVHSEDAIKVLTLRTTAFSPAPTAPQPAPIKSIGAKALDTLGTTFVTQTTSTSERPELTNAEIVVSGGRGLGSKDNFKLIDTLASALGAAVGASRAAVDAEYVPNDYQVGQTGKVVAPRLYLAIGISGAIQHLAGMQDSQTIVAINKDEEAPIMQIADYALVADLFEVVPALIKALNTSS